MKRTLLSIVTLVCTISAVNCMAGLNVELNTEPWLKLMQDIARKPLLEENKKWIASIQQKLPSFREIISTSLETNKKVSNECRSDMTLYNQGISNAKLWAMTMFDASAKFPESTLSGAFAFFGNFDQCLSMKKEDFKNAPYSAVANGVVIYIRSLKPSSKLGLVFALQSCMPESCTSDDIKEIYESVLFRLLLMQGAFTVIFTPKELVLTGEDKPALDAPAIVVIVLYSCLVVMVGLATLYDVFGKKFGILKGTFLEILLSFSAVKNIRTLMDMTVSPTSISCLHGLRVLSLFWVMLGHRFAIQIAGFNMNTKDAIELLESTMGAFVFNGYPSVDTFFFISGFLMCYVFISDMNKKRPFNIFIFYFYRYIRLTAPLAMVVAFYAAIFPYIIYGPLWKISSVSVPKTCKENWWLTLLYFNNYIRPDPSSNLMCIPQSWYLSVDMQLAWLSPLVLVPLWKWPKRTCQIFLPLLIAASCFAPFTSTYINEFPLLSTNTVDAEKAFRFQTEMYQVMHMRATPYLVGIAFAYFMIQFKDIKISLNWWQVALCWCISTGACLAIVLAGAIVYSPNYVYDPVAAAFYGGFHRLAWSISLSWIVFACTRSYAGIVNSILSWPGWLPLSRLSYTAFLTHFIIIDYQSTQKRTNGYYTDFNAIQIFLSDIMMVMLSTALVLHIFCEAPTLNILKLLFKKSGPKKEIKDNKNEKP